MSTTINLNNVPSPLASKKPSQKVDAVTTPSEETTYVVFKDFNSVSFEARVQHVEVKAGQYGEFVSVTCITNLKDGEQGIAVRFIAGGSILTLAKSGALMAGRRVHLTGAIVEVASSYVDTDGVVIPLSRPRVELKNVNLQLGAKPKSARSL